MKRKIFALILVILGPVTLASAGTYIVDQAHSDVSFKVRHLVSKTAGQFTDFDGTIVADWNDLDASSVAFTIKVETKKQ